MWVQEFIAGFLEFWQNTNLATAAHLLWFFILYELLRYVALDIILLVFYRLKPWLFRRKYEHARSRFWLEQPLVSILIPGKNEGANIYKLIQSLHEIGRASCRERV